MINGTLNINSNIRSKLVGMQRIRKMSKYINRNKNKFKYNNKYNNKYNYNHNYKLKEK